VYLSIAAAIFSLGIAAFHTDAIRIVVETAPARAATVIGTFTFAGSAGYALGPLVVAGALAVIAPEAAPLMALLPLAAAILIARRRQPSLVLAERFGVSQQRTAPHESHWRSFSLVAALAAARSGLSTGLQSFVPIYFVIHLRLASSEGSMLLSGMLAAAGVGSLLGGAAIDRLGARSIAIGTLGLAVAGLVSAVLMRHAFVPEALLLVALGLDACFTATVVLANGCLPGRAGLATGLTLSIGTVTGGLAAAGLTMLAARANADAGLYALVGLAVIGTTLALATSPRAGGLPAVYA
jgi:FSR family fosmidomycin resistance protein-like MFS transporter